MISHQKKDKKKIQGETWDGFRMRNFALSNLEKGSIDFLRGANLKIIV